MKKIFICLLLTIVLITNVFVFAEDDLTLPTASNESTQTSVPTEEPTPTAKPVETPKVTPSVTAPMTFTVTTDSGETSIIQGSSSETTLKFTVKPNGKEDFTINKIVNKDTGTSYNINESISKSSSGWSDSLTVAFNHTDTDKTVTFELQWTDFDDNQRKTTALFKINVATPKLTISAAPEGPIVPGAPIIIKYHIANVGNVTVKDVLLQDPTAAYLDSSIIFSSEPVLAPGQIFERQATIVLDGEATLSPSATYTYNGQTYTATGEQVKLTATEVIPTLTLSCENFTASYKGAMHTFNYTITNNTQVVLKNVHVYDGDEADAGIVEGPFDIEVGAIYTGTYETKVEKPGYYKFKITYTYDGADGEKQQSAKTEEPLTLPGDIMMYIKNVTPEKLDDSGEMTFTIVVENGTNNELKNIAVEEESSLIDRIELGSIPAASGSKPGRNEYEIKVKIPIEATLVQFNLHYTINDELFIINDSYEIEYIGSAGLTTVPPTDLPVIGTPTIPVQGENNTTFLMILGWILPCLLILLLLFIIILIIVFIILKNRKNAKTANISVKRKMNNAFDDFDYDDYDEFSDIDGEFIDGIDDAVNAGGAVTAAILGTDDAINASEDTISVPKVNANTEETVDLDNTVGIDDEGVKIYKKK